jgi:hypothetical protein
MAPEVAASLTGFGIAAHSDATASSTAPMLSAAATDASLVRCPYRSDVVANLECRKVLLTKVLD